MWGKESFFQEVSFPHEKKHKIHNPAFSFGTRGAKEKAWQKENAIFVGLLAPNPRKLLKKLDQNFHTWVQCEHNAFNGECTKQQ